jgi:hypothetical protein
MMDKPVHDPANENGLFIDDVISCGPAGPYWGIMQLAPPPISCGKFETHLERKKGWKEHQKSAADVCVLQLGKEGYVILNRQHLAY